MSNSPDSRRLWLAGCGPIHHGQQTQQRIAALAAQLVASGRVANEERCYAMLAAADRLTCAGMNVVAHMTYAKRIDLDGEPLGVDDFKPTPEGHTGGALNMVPAYVGYLLANALSGETRSWLMGQGHCVAAIDALNLLTGNLSPAHADRYALDAAGLATFVQDFYRCTVGADGLPVSPLGSHVNCHTAGGISEGGYLGFAELQYAHMPLPGEKLVAFLSDGAAEEQRGSDWIPRWWRAEDCGPALPIMIANGRRIEQRTELGTIEGMQGFIRHLRGCGFDPIEFDGRDPAAFVCTIWEMEQRLERRVKEKNNGILSYPLPIPYGIANTIKGFGFYGADENKAHNLPLPGNPHTDEKSRQLFNKHIKPLYVTPEDMRAALALLNTHTAQNRPLERDHPLANRHPKTPVQPELHYRDDACSTMAAVDRYFVDLVTANPDLRPRVGNPDELASNRLTEVLKTLRP